MHRFFFIICINIENVSTWALNIISIWISDDVLALDPSTLVPTFGDKSGFAFSPWFTVSDGDCLSVAYYTFLASMNTFGILLEAESGHLYPLYNATPAYDQVWNYVQLHLPQGHWRIMLAGFRSTMRAGLVAVNYVNVASDVCPSSCKWEIGVAKGLPWIILTS